MSRSSRYVLLVATANRCRVLRSLARTRALLLALPAAQVSKFCILCVHVRVCVP